MVSQLTSQTIKLLRIPLITLVVCNHVFPVKPSILYVYEHASFSISFFDDVLIWILASPYSLIRNPILFVIAGFLFFQKLDKWNSQVWKTKMKSRLSTIFMPYFVWNTLLIAMIGVKKVVIGGIDSSFQFLFDNNWHFYWNYETYNPLDDLQTWEQIYPIVGPFWFMRDLMVSFVLSPLIYWLIKYLKHAFIIVLSIAYLFNLPTMYFGLGLNYWFCLGAYIAVNDWDFVDISRRVGKWAGLLSFVLLGVSLYFYEPNSLIRIGIYPLYILSFSTFVVYLFSLLAEKKKGKLFEKYSSDTFFIFASHWFVLAVLGNVNFMQSLPAIILFLIALLIVVLCIVCHRICIRLLPRLTFLLTGKKYERKQS